MTNRSIFFKSTVSALALVSGLPTARADVPNIIARPDYQNVSGASNSGGVLFFNGNISNGTNGTIPAGEGWQLRESTFGHPGSGFAAPYSGFANNVLFNTGLNGNPAVYPMLYPAGFGTPAGVSGSRTQLANPSTGGAFRYKWLMYGDDPNNGGIDILNLFADSSDSDDWFTEADRATALAQADVLREALAYSPLDNTLQSALLDVYYDLGVVEMLKVNKKRVKLAKLRLGLELAGGPFIIDSEIDLLRGEAGNAPGRVIGILESTDRVLTDYGNLLTLEMEGFEPGDVDPSAGGAPFGYWLFQRRVPTRSQTPTQYATAVGGPVEDVVVPTGNDPISNYTFSGYKDYRTLLTVLGQDIQARADLARLLGMRQATGDMTEARNQISLAQGPRAADFSAIRNLFASVDFDDPLLDATGVRAAITLVETALNDTVNVRAFLNGRANMLGLDPNFLILLQPPSNTGPLFDTYDILDDKLRKVNGTGPVGPLAIALTALGDPNNATTGGGAIQAYSTFRESVDRVSSELVGLETDFETRIIKVTGYTAENLPDPWDGTPNPSSPSEMATVNTTIDSLNRQNETLAAITLQLLDDITKANDAVSIADSIDETITGAQASYLGTSSEAWTEIHLWAGSAAASQAATDTAFNSVTTVSPLGIPAPNVISIVAGAANTEIQTAAAIRTSQREAELDKAAIGFQTTLALANLPLAVKQAQLEVGALMREAYANRFEIEDNFTALAQSISDKTSLIREVTRLREILDSSRSALAGRYYADPIHFVRSERQNLIADAEFRRAQRWVFFTARALEYKWQERFSYADATIGESYDIGRIFSARNARELETVVTKMVQFNGDREASPGSHRPDRTTISLRDHILTPNPADVNREFGAFPPDQGLRFEPSTGTTVSTVTRFRNILRELQANPGPGGGINGPINIPFDTTTLEFGQFFAGPDYSNPDSIKSGLYRDKINWIAVHLVFKDGALVKGNAVPSIPGNNGIDGAMTYSGNTFFRTRVPPCPDRQPGVTSLGDSQIPGSGGSGQTQPRLDYPGEFVIAPFRYYTDTNFTGIFDLHDSQIAPSIEYLFSTQSAEVPAVENRILAETGFQIPDFKERSVATTRWLLEIDSNQFDINDLVDIELIIQHNAYTRPQITCP